MSSSQTPSFMGLPSDKKETPKVAPDMLTAPKPALRMAPLAPAPTPTPAPAPPPARPVCDVSLPPGAIPARFRSPQQQPGPGPRPQPKASPTPQSKLAQPTKLTPSPRYAQSTVASRAATRGNDGTPSRPGVQTAKAPISPVSRPEPKKDTVIGIASSSRLSSASNTAIQVSPMQVAPIKNTSAPTTIDTSAHPTQETTAPTTNQTSAAPTHKTATKPLRRNQGSTSKDAVESRVTKKRARSPSPSPPPTQVSSDRQVRRSRRLTEAPTKCSKSNENEPPKNTTVNGSQNAPKSNPPVIDAPVPPRGVARAFVSGTKKVVLESNPPAIDAPVPPRGVARAFVRATKKVAPESDPPVIDAPVYPRGVARAFVRVTKKVAPESNPPINDAPGSTAKPENKKRKNELDSDDEDAGQTTAQKRRFIEEKKMIDLEKELERAEQEMERRRREKKKGEKAKKSTERKHLSKLR